MKKVIFLGLLLSIAARAEGDIRFRTGEMRIGDYVEMVSNAMQLQVSFSEMSTSSAKVDNTRPGPMSKEQAMASFLSLLQSEGYTLIHDKNLDLYRVLRQRDARDLEVPLVTEESELPDNELMVSYALPLKHLQAEGLARALRSFAPANSRLIPSEENKLLFITDTARSMKKYREIAARLDNPKGAADATAYLKARKLEDDCATPSSISHQGIFIVLFALIGLIMGFMIRGYVIRRIEGGL